MTLLSAKLSSEPCGKCTERNALIYLDIVSDYRCFSDYDTRAVIDEKALSYRCARIDIDARAAVRIFGHDSRYQRHARLIKDMCRTIDKYREKAGI